MPSTTTDVTAIEPLTHQEAMRCQAAELDRTLALLRTLDDEAWMAPTDCPAWDIRSIYQHVLGARKPVPPCHLRLDPGFPRAASYWA